MRIYTLSTALLLMALLCPNDNNCPIFAHGFVRPSRISLPNIPISTTSPTKTTRATSALFAVEPSDGAVIVKKAAFGMVVVAPKAKKAAAAAAAAAASQVDASPVVVEATTTTATPPPPVVQAAVTVTPPPVVAQTPPPPVVADTVATKVSKVAASAATTSPPAAPAVATSNPLPLPPANTVLEIVPKPVNLDAVATTKATTTMSTADMLEAIRQNHWASMPKVTETTLSSGHSAPPLVDVLKERNQELAGYVEANGPAAWQTVQDNANQAGRNLRLLVDPDTYSNIREQVMALKDSDTPLTWEQVQQWLGVEAIRTNLAQFQDTDAFLRQFKLDKLVHNLNMNSQAVQTSWNEFMASLAALQTALLDGTTSADDLVQAMNLKETGGWYMGVAGLVGWMALSGVTSDENSQKIIMTEAAMPDTSKPKVEEPDMDAIVNEQVSKLKEATAAVYEQLDEMKSEKDSRAYEVAAMRSEMRTVMQELNANRAQEQKLRESLEHTQEQLDRETNELRQQLMERVAAEEELRDQLAETKDRLAVEMTKVAEAKKQAEMEVEQAEAQVRQLEVEKAQMEDEMTTLRLEMEALQKQLNAKYMPTPPKEPPILKEDPTTGELMVNGSHGKSPVNGDSSASLESTSAAATATLPKTTRRKPRAAAKKKKAVALPTTSAEESYNNLSDAFFAAISDPVEPEVDTPKKAATVKKVALSKKSVMDWSKLSASTLKRKTVKELTGYLLNKGGETTGPDGKTLKKDFLVQNILAAH